MKLFIKNLRRRSRVLLENKRTAGILLVVAMLGTVLSVKLLKSFWESSSDDTNGPTMEKLLDGKRAVSLVVKTSNMPIDVLYPGAKVDVTDIKNGDVLYLARDVAIAGLSVSEEGEFAKVTLALDTQDSENVIKNRSETISLILNAESDRDSSDIEIVEL